MNQFNTIINSLEDKNIVGLLAHLRKESRHIHYKDEPETNRTLIYLTYQENTNDLTQIERECRSVVLDRQTLKVISYSMDEIYTQDQRLLSKLDTTSHTIYECLEGTFLSVYYFNDKWYVSTRRCLDAQKSEWLSKKSHYDLMMECVSDGFFDNLNNNYNYYFVLQHHENKGVVDYTKRYGKEYKRLVLSFIRDKQTHELLTDVCHSQTLTNYGVKLIEELSDMNLLKEQSNCENIFSGVEYEGLLVRITDDTTKYLRLPTERYMRYSEVMPNAQNKYVAFLKLYQTGTLKEHIKYVPENISIKNPVTSATYDTVGVVDSCFQVLVKELYNLFRLMYNLKHGEQMNKHLYQLLPAGYHDALYKIKGIFFRKRLEYNEKKIANYKLTERDIYYLLKSYNLNELVFLLRGRKMLHEAMRTNKSDPQYQTLASITMGCDVKQLNLTRILLNLMFSE